MAPVQISPRTQFWLMRRVTGSLALIGQRERVWAWRKERARQRRRAEERRGSDRLSRPALNDLDSKLDAIIDLDGGYFVEAGGNDGFTQSNTYWLERFRGWRGLLVEPMPELAAQARLERPSSTVIEVALVSSDYAEPTVRMVFGDLMTSVAGSMDGEESDWAAIGLSAGWHDPSQRDVPARTLTQVLDEVGAPEVDLLSLDVEGYEEDVLRGLDLDRHAPRYLLIEMHDPDAMRPGIEAALGARFTFAEMLSHVDALYVRADVRR